MASSTLAKELLHNTIADSVYKEITSRTGHYYYFLGQVLAWDDPENPPLPVDSASYERDVRKNIVIVKEIQSSDVAYVIDRVDWTSGTVYDNYDDEFSTQILGLDLLNGGSNYSSNANVVISGTTGAGANVTPIVANGVITGFVFNNRGYGYTTTPNVIISDEFGSSANARAVINRTYAGANSLIDANFYVITDDFNIYKCLDNNYESPSTIKPTDVSPEAFTTTDGYKWKFMGNVPIYLRNKFLTSSQMPVTTSVSSNFYSKGAFRNISVINTGNNYSYASIAVVGDGYREADPYVIGGAYIANSGNGYTTATLTVEPPVSGATPWLGSNVFTTGQIISYNNNYYEVLSAGTTASWGPVHTVGVASNGTAILKFKGTGITANAVISGGNITSIANLTAAVNEVIITSGGSGYLSAPTVNFSGGGGSGATATAVLTGNTVTRIIINDSGSGYTAAPTVTLGTLWTANANVLVNTQVYYNTYLYTVTTGGYANTIAPTHTSGTQTLGNAAFTFAGTRATATASTKYGAGYTKIPTATVTGDGANAEIVLTGSKSEAVLYPYVENGKITRVIIDDPGIGYTYASLTVAGDGANAELRADFSVGDLETLQSTSELLATPGAIHTIKVVSGGYNYTTATVSINGDGSGATANAILVNGKVDSVEVITEGSGYTFANVTISGNGVGATARAILPPYGGHGKDTVSELFAKSLAFYTTVSRERNQGFDVTNDYRQFGIVKDVRNYNNDKYFIGDSGSGCWVLTANVNSSIFSDDTVITRTSDSAKFLIVSSTDTGMIVISLDNKVPSQSDVMQAPNSNVFTVSAVTAPDVDKYSGELLYIDNRPAFTTTADQSVSIKTVFKY